MRLQTGRIDHDRLRISTLGGKADHDAGEDTVIAPALPAIAEGLRRSIFPRRTAPSQAVAADEDNAAQHPQIIDAWAAMALGKVGAKAHYGSRGCRQLPSASSYHVGVGRSADNISTDYERVEAARTAPLTTNPRGTERWMQTCITLLDPYS